MKLIKEFVSHMIDNWSGVIYPVFVMALGVLVLCMDGEVI